MNEDFNKDSNEKKSREESFSFNNNRAAESSYGRMKRKRIHSSESVYSSRQTDNKFSFRRNNHSENHAYSHKNSDGFRRGSNQSYNSFSAEKESGFSSRNSYEREKTPYADSNNRGNRNFGYRKQSQESYGKRYSARERDRRENTPYQERGGFQKPFSTHAKYSMKKQLEYKEKNFDPNAPIRLNKYLANAGICSRRDADKYIEAGVVTVNGKVVTELGTKVLRSDTVSFHDTPVNIEKKVYIILNKPKGYVTTSEDPQNRKTVMDLVGNACKERIFSVGRLDRNTTGVLLFTNDGELAAKLTHPQYMKKKIYHVYLDRNISLGELRQIADGIKLDDGVIKADEIQYASTTDKKQVGIEIHSGRNRIVRRIFEHLGYKVVKLDRVYFAGLTKKKLSRGDWRFLTQQEVNMLKQGAFE